MASRAFLVAAPRPAAVAPTALSPQIVPGGAASSTVAAAQLQEFGSATPSSAKLLLSGSLLGLVGAFSARGRARRGQRGARLGATAVATSAVSGEVSSAPVSGTGKGNGGLDVVTLRHSSGQEAEIYLHGATVVSWKAADGKDLIFCSPKAIFDGKKAIRGGVPVVFPQFGQPDKGMAQHGFARVMPWQLKEVKDTVEESRAVFTLSETPETRQQWDHAFSLEYTVSLTAAGLNLNLRVINSDTSDFDFQTLLHTYLQIPDISDATISGLTGRTYIDKIKNTTEVETREAVNIPALTDCVYLADDALLKPLVVSHEGAPVWAVTCEARVAGEIAPCDVVAWNPYEEGSPGDLPVPAYKNFLCVEPGLVGKQYTLAPGHVAELTQTLLPVA